MAAMRKLNLTGWILVGLLAGIVVGLLQHWLLPDAVNQATVTYVHDPIGRIFLNGIRLLVVPLVLVSLTLGTAAIGDLNKLGRIGGKTMAIYLTTTALAISIGFGLAFAVQPGTGLSIPVDADFTAGEAPPVTDILVDIVPTNPFVAMVEGQMLQVIFVALLAGLAIARVGPRADPLVRGLQAADQVIQTMVTMVMAFAPIGVFSLIAEVLVTEGLAVFVPLLKYMATVLGSLGLHAFVVYPTLLVLLARLKPWQFLRNVYPAQVVAFSTSSSNASLPVTMEVAEDRLGTREEVHSFTLPLGATINMDGTAIMQGVATVFIANVYGVDLGPAEFFRVVLMATLASIGTAGVPGVGLIMLSMVLTELGLPVEGIGIILGVDRLLDMTRTAVNVTGDLMCTAVVARSEGEFEPAVFGAENTGRRRGRE
jgi:Na+/H+-dicarboxylate symporter